MSVNSRQCITLTSDFGTKDYYVAAAKGSIIRAFNEGEDFNVIDISHQISPFNIAEAAFVIGSTYMNFPKGTVHCISVNNLASSDNHIAMLYDDHYFICGDNGLLSLIMQKRADKIVFIDKIQSLSDKDNFPMKDLYPTAACHLARGGTLEVIGTPTESIVQRTVSGAISQGDSIIAHVSYIDHFGNVICNLNKQTFEKKRDGRKFEILFSLERNKITKLSKKYADVPLGEKLAFFNDQNLLEIAINGGANGQNGGASQLFGISLQSSIRINFL